MKSLLNAVQITSTFRVIAESPIEAVKLATAPKNDAIEVTSVDRIESGVFLVQSKHSELGYTYSCVSYVEHASSGYRIECCEITLTQIEIDFLIGGDDLVNEREFFVDIENGNAITATEYEEKVAHWIADDLEKETPNRMESYIKSKYSKAHCVDGVIIAILGTQSKDQPKVA